MADDEQFSLCWNNFNSNLSAGFHESLCRGDLVDVTLAAEGQFVKAHRLVLSVCSPYFRKMFTQMPSNQHAFVFLKDVSHTALKDLIQFMYCGEVNVKQEALPAFISTAEALQIKGLTDSDPPPPPQQQQPTEPAAPAPQTQIHNVSNTPPRARHRTTTRTYKLETVDADEDEQPHHQTQTKAPQTTQIVIQTAAAPSATIGAQQQQLHQVVQGATVQQITSVAAPASSSSAGTVVTTTQKRALRTSGGPNLKRTKNSSTTTTTSTSLADPLDTANEAVSSQPQQITVQTAIVTTAATSDKNQSSTSTETEYIDLPIEIPTKSEPDYTEEAGEAEGADQDGTYGEDDSYGDMRYDDTYFTENEDGGNTTTGGGTSTSATTSKTVIKQQQSSFSDSSFTAAADSGEQTNNDAQAIVNTNETITNPEDVIIFFTQSLRGRPAIMANGIRFLIMSENKKKILWRCSSMATKKIKCPARITMLKEDPPKFIINKAVHVHAELKRNKYGSNKQQYYNMQQVKPEQVEIDGAVFEILETTEVAHEEHQSQHANDQQSYDHHQQQQEQDPEHGDLIDEQEQQQVVEEVVAPVRNQILQEQQQQQHKPQQQKQQLSLLSIKTELCHNDAIEQSNQEFIANVTQKK